MQTDHHRAVFWHGKTRYRSSSHLCRVSSDFSRYLPPVSSGLQKILISPQVSQSYAQATKSSKLSATTQTDENITKLKYPPLKLLPQPSSLSKQNISPSIPSTSASSVQADLLTSTSPIADISETELVNPIPNNVPSTTNISAFASNSPLRGLTFFRRVRVSRSRGALVIFSFSLGVYCLW
ncbi:hypothetical protein TNCV_1645101 [Trichonephila clavipes]|nr:hypothetical protein TNCV_1645101 [Trichonephila clavipes]